MKNILIALLLVLPLLSFAQTPDSIGFTIETVVVEGDTVLALQQTTRTPTGIANRFNFTTEDIQYAQDSSELFQIMFNQGFNRINTTIGRYKQASVFREYFLLNNYYKTIFNSFSLDWDAMVTANYRSQLNGEYRLRVETQPDSVYTLTIQDHPTRNDLLFYTSDAPIGNNGNGAIRVYAGGIVQMVNVTSQGDSRFLVGSTNQRDRVVFADIRSTVLPVALGGLRAIDSVILIKK